MQSKAKPLMDFIRKTEVGTAGREGYDVIYGFNQGKLSKPITEMTLATIQREQGKWFKRFGSSATGGYQFMKATLKGLIQELNLDPKLQFTPELQDRLGYHLLKRRKFEEFLAGQISKVEFGRQLAMEWASFPVLANTQGAHRAVQRGETYYAGDRLNKALVAPEIVEAMLDRMVRSPRVVETLPPASVKRPGVIAVVIAALAATAAWFSLKACDWTGLFCGD